MGYTFLTSEGTKNGANEIDMAIYDKQTNNWTLLEGTVCQVGTNADKAARNRKNTQSYVPALKNFMKARALNKSILFLTFSEAAVKKERTKLNNEH